MVADGCAPCPVRRPGVRGAINAHRLESLDELPGRTTSLHVIVIRTCVSFRYRKGEVFLVGLWATVLGRTELWGCWKGRLNPGFVTRILHRRRVYPDQIIV